MRNSQTVRCRTNESKKAQPGTALNHRHTRGSFRLRYTVNCRHHSQQSSPSSSYLQSAQAMRHLHLSSVSATNKQFATSNTKPVPTKTPHVPHAITLMSGLVSTNYRVAYAPVENEVLMKLVSGWIQRDPPSLVAVNNRLPVPGAPHRQTCLRISAVKFRSKPTTEHCS